MPITKQHKAVPIAPPTRGGAREGSGRPAIKPGEETVVVSFRATAAQAEKFRALGGGAWARPKIDRAKVKP